MQVIYVLQHADCKVWVIGRLNLMLLLVCTRTQKGLIQLRLCNYIWFHIIFLKFQTDEEDFNV